MAGASFAARALERYPRAVITAAPKRLRVVAPLLAIQVLIAGLATMLWASAAGATSHSCGTYSSDSIYPRAQVFAGAGVGCHRALRVAKRFDHQGRAPGPWQCFLGHAGKRLFSCGYPHPAAGQPITGAKHAFWARGTGRSFVDHKPPVFAGLTSAVNCIPGPGIGGGSSRYTLRWSPATDDQTPQAEIVYDIYQASVPGGEDFSKPTYTSAPGATSFTTPPLSNSHSWSFVVRARDLAGNRDSNRVERAGQNLCV